MTTTEPAHERDHNSADRYRSGVYLDQNPTYHEADSPWKVARVQELLQANSFTPWDIHDVGCGSGLVSEQMSRLYPKARTHGWDISRQAIARATARRVEGTNVEFRVGDFSSADVTADLVLCLDVFEHVDDYLGFLARVCERSHRVVFHIPLELSVFMALRPAKFLDIRAQVGHLHHFCIETARATLTDAGFRLLDEVVTPSSIALTTTRNQRIARVPRSLLFRASPQLAAKTLGGCSLLVLAAGALERSGLAGDANA